MDRGRGSNIIIFVHEKNNQTCITRSMRDFGEFINSCSLRDCPLRNAKFTWTNGQSNLRLDRFLISPEWEELYPCYSQEGISKIVFDH